MKRCLITSVLLGLTFLICFLPSVILAQEKTQEEEEMEYSWGILSSVSSDQIVVTEYDYEKDKEISVTYTIDPKAKFTGVDSLKDIKVGDNLEIDYVVIDNKKVAKVIAVVRLPEKAEKPLPLLVPEEEEKPLLVPEEEVVE